MRIKFWELKLRNSRIKQDPLKNNFQDRNAWEFIFSHIFAPLKLLTRPYARPYASRFRIHQNRISYIKSTLAADWYNNCCLRYIYFTLLKHNRLFTNFS
jgi:hypothetical protein